MIISRTPLRISFFGGGTDYNEYFERKPCAILGTTIDKYVYVTINQGSPFFEHKIRVAYSKHELAQSPADLAHPSVRETLKFLKMDRPEDYLDIHIFADLPAKTGLGSSSSFTVGFLNACYAFRGEFVGKDRLAREAIHIEQKLIGDRVGIQDQTHAAYGGLNIIRRHGSLHDGSSEVSPVVLSPENRTLLESSVLLFYTGVTRFASELVAEQVENTKTLALDDYLARMHDQVFEAQDVLSRESGAEMLKKFGALLHEAWTLKKRLSTKVTAPEFDALYEKARNAGAYGGKIGGAGGGGFLMLVVPAEKQAAVRAALSGLLEVRFAFESQGSSIIYSHEPPRYSGRLESLVR